MSSLIVALLIIILITGLASIHAALIAERADRLLESAGSLIDRPDAEAFDALREEWDAVEPLIRATVHEERLRAVEDALVELESAIGSGNGVRRAAGLLIGALDSAFERERINLRQIF